MLYCILDAWPFPWRFTMYLTLMLYYSLVTYSKTDDFPTTRTALAVLGSGPTLESLLLLLYSRCRSSEVLEP